MSQRRNDNVSEPFWVAEIDTSLLTQEKLSARQAKRAAKAAERRQRSDALKEEVCSFSCISRRVRLDDHT